MTRSGMKGSGRLLAPLLLLSALSVSGCSQGPSPGPARHLLLITLDTTRQDRLSCYGYAKKTTPHLDDLAARGVVFRDAYASAPITLPSHATILTGTHPFYHGARDNGLYTVGPANVTLAERLKEAHFITGAVVSAAVLKPLYGLDQGFDHYDAGVHEGFRPTGHVAERPANEVTEQALKWLRGVKGERLFLWAHYFDPHAPWMAPEEYAQRFGQGYDAEVAFMDHEIGRLLDGLDDLDLLDDTLVVAVADHGEGLGDHREITHGLFLYEETVKVPLLMAGPGVPAGIEISGVVRTTDIMPTVLDLLGLDLPGVAPTSTVQGVSLRKWIAGGEPLLLDAYFETYMPETTFGWSWLEGVRRGELPVKYIDAPRPEIYELDKDPGEQHNLAPNIAAEQRDPLTSLARLLQRLRSERPASEQPLSSPLRLSEEARRELEALGYVALSAERSQQRGPDPKDEYDLLLRKEQAMELLNRGEFDRALESFRAFLHAVPRKGLAHELVATTLGMQAMALAQQGRTRESEMKIREAVEHYKATVASMPDYVMGHYNLAMAYGQIGDTKHQVAHLNHCLELDPEFLPAQYYLGLYFMDRHEWERAFERLDFHWRHWRPRAGMPEREGALSYLYSGACLLRLGRDAEGEARIRRAQEMDPANPEPDFYLGELAFKRSDKALARKHLVRFLQRAAGMPQAVRPEMFGQAQRMLEKLGVPGLGR
ncbi:MAG: sulfatase-like hydrolase/transferase [Planctomycetota bacterium]